MLKNDYLINENFKIMRIGIDATNIGGGGGVTHLYEILNNFCQNRDKCIEKLTVFSSQRVLSQLPDGEFIQKITFPFLNKNIIFRTLFQITKFDKEIKKNCDILLSLTGDYIGNFTPLIGMSRNMLLYEKEVWKQIKQPKEIIRFWLLYNKQKISFMKSSGIIFISHYAKDIITKQINLIGKEIIIINHGISPRFYNQLKEQHQISFYSEQMPFRFIYVSTIHVYKHQCNVIEAISNLKKRGFPVTLDLIGEIIFNPEGKKLFKTIDKVDPNGNFIFYHGHIPYKQLDDIYKNADGVIYASTCENMPNILMECMASGLPIACSDKQPMPEFLKENGFYFNSHDINSIEKALEMLLLNIKLRERMVLNNLEEAKKYQWSNTSNQTFNFIKKIYNLENNS